MQHLKLRKTKFFKIVLQFLRKEEPTTISEDKNRMDSLFRSAAHNSMPQLPENAVDANQLEKSGNKTGASLFGPGLDKGVTPVLLMFGVAMFFFFLQKEISSSTEVAFG